ncbi:MAG: hypothetical protein OQK82_08915 [Candidatus Pacearchaeota archaeon]|nr:hypothetical protein [Candidatus Pacearchaeota archaeon]
MKKYFLFVIFIMLLSCSEEDEPKEYTYFPFVTKTEYFMDADGGEIRVDQSLGSDIEDDNITIGSEVFKVFNEKSYFLFRFNLNIIYFFIMENNPSEYRFMVYDKQGKAIKDIQIEKTAVLNYIEIDNNFGIYIEDKKGIIQISYLNSMFY